jgi:hypothetical protein
MVLDISRLNICSCIASSSVLEGVHTRSVNDAIWEAVPHVGVAKREEMLSHGCVSTQFL